MAIVTLNTEKAVNGHMVRVGVLWDEPSESRSEANRRLQQYLQKVVSRHKAM
jgi:hypothetical protein